MPHPLPSAVVVRNQSLVGSLPVSQSVAVLSDGLGNARVPSDQISARSASCSQLQYLEMFDRVHAPALARGPRREIPSSNVPAPMENAQTISEHLCLARHMTDSPVRIAALAYLEASIDPAADVADLQTAMHRLDPDKHKDELYAYSLLVGRKTAGAESVGYLNTALANAANAQARLPAENLLLVRQDKDQCVEVLKRALALSNNHATNATLSNTIAVMGTLSHAVMREIPRETFGELVYNRPHAIEASELPARWPTSLGLFANKMQRLEEHALALVEHEHTMLLQRALEPESRALAELRLALQGDGSAVERLQLAIELASDPELQARAYYHLAAYKEASEAVSHLQRARELSCDPQLQALCEFMLGLRDPEHRREHFDSARLLTRSEHLLERIRALSATEPSED